MTEQSATPQENAVDTALREELATGFRLLGDDSPLKRFYVRLAKTEAEHTPTPIDMAAAAMAFSKKLERLALPENPNDISTGMLERFTESLSNAEVKALQYAAGRDDTLSRRSILSYGLAVGAAMTAGGATAWAFQARNPSPAHAKDTSSNAATQDTATHSVPESTILLTFGGALITVASLMQNLRKRKENTSAFVAERHLPKTAAEILVGTDKQLRQALAASKARESGGNALG